jgi:iron complex transport system permease protein
MNQQILGMLRLPRVLSGLLIGANLAVAGAMMQGLTRNSLASPSTLGINAGAACFMALGSIGFIGLAQIPTIASAAIGGVVSGVLVLVLGGFFSDRPHPLKLILAGIAINALLIGLMRASVILADDMAYSVINWLAGSISSVDWKQWHILWPPSLVGLILAFSLCRSMNLLGLGDDVASSLGVNLTLIRWLVCIAIIVLTASSISIAGPIGFVGLLIPHIVRKLFGSNYFLVIPMSAMLGAALIVWSDAIARAIAFPGETPVGVVTALIGTPCFIFLAARNRW